MTKPEITRHYADRDLFELGEHYVRHVRAMTAEKLHDKTDIAAELAFRDAELSSANERIAELEREAVNSADRLHEARGDVHRLTKELSALRASMLALADKWYLSNAQGSTAETINETRVDCAAELTKAVEK